MPAKKTAKKSIPGNASVRKNTVSKKSAGKKIPLKSASGLTPPPALSGKKKLSNDSFFDSVFQVARLIPKGRVSTYGAIAEYLGTKLSARMVGWAMNAAGSAVPPVPAHRVVNRNGMLSGKHHFATPTLMEDLLRQERITVKNDKIVEFEKLFWNPNELD